MKNIVKLMLVSALTLVWVACDKHDKLDELTFVGKMAPTVHWTIPNTTVTAGNGVTFSAQYYTTGEVPVSHCEVWYDVNEVETKSVSAPWVVSKPYTVASDLTAKQRISTKIATYAHDTVQWNDKERAYKFTSTFPTSNTLGRVAWGGKDYSDDKVKANFGDNFMAHFKDSLYNYLMDDANHLAAYNDFKKLLEKDSAAMHDLFSPYDTISFDENSQTDYNHFKGDTVPKVLEDYFLAMSFKQLITNSVGDIIINYSRQYTLNAQLKCVDKNGTAGLSSVTTITLN